MHTAAGGGSISVLRITCCYEYIESSTVVMTTDVAGGWHICCRYSEIGREVYNIYENIKMFVSTGGLLV